MINQLQIHQQQHLAEHFPDFSDVNLTSGGHMAYHRLGISNSSETLFIKAHDPSILGNERRIAEMSRYLTKESVVYRHLRNHNYSHIPQTVKYQSDMLIMSGLTEADNWYWRAPSDSVLFHQYVKDVLVGLTEIEAVPLPDPIEDDEVSLTIFYDNGWDILRETDAEQLVKGNIKKWGDKINPVTLEHANFMSDQIGKLAISRSEVSGDVLNHHDARQANLTWHPEHGLVVVDWSWAHLGLRGGDATMFLLDLYKSGHEIENYQHIINIDYARLLLGYWLHRSSTEHMEGNEKVRFQQFISAVETSRLLSTLL